MLAPAFNAAVMKLWRSEWLVMFFVIPAALATRFTIRLQEIGSIRGSRCLSGRERCGHDSGGTGT